MLTGQLVEVILEEGNVLILVTFFSNFSAFHRLGAGGGIKFLDLDIFYIDLLGFLLFGSCGFFLVLCESTFAGSGKRLDVEHDHGGVLGVEVVVLLVGRHVFPFSDDSGDNFGLAQVGQCFLEFVVPLSGELSIGGPLGPALLSAFS